MRSKITALAILVLLATATPVAAAGRDRGYVPPAGRAHGHSATELAGTWYAWTFGTPPDENPTLAGRCEQSPSDPMIWFLPVSLGGDYSVDCAVPAGAFLVVSPGGYECSAAEGNGSTEAELRACAEEGFPLLTHAELWLDGIAAERLDQYVVTSPLVNLPGPNLFGDAASPGVFTGYLVVVHPLSRGEHTLRAYDEFAELNFTAGITYNITVR